MLIFAIAFAASVQLQGCLNSGDAAQGVTPAMAACFVADYQRADAALNASYKAAIARLPAARRAALRTSQRGWIARRDRACAIDNGPGAGTIETLNHPACLAAQTRRRTAWLARYR